MATIDLKAVIGRLNGQSRRALEAAAGLTMSRTNYNVEIEHWLVKLCDQMDSDFATILRHYEVDPARLAHDLDRSLDRMKTGSARGPSLSPDIVEWVKQAWLFASMEQAGTRVRSGHLLWALMADDGLARRARDISGELVRITPDLLKRDFATITAGSAEAAEATATPDGTPPPRDGEARPAGNGALELYTTDLTARARAGKLDPIIGRDFELRQAIDILTRRRQNNPILTGEAGVGKTAVVEGPGPAPSHSGRRAVRRSPTSLCGRSTSGCCRPARA